MKKKTAFKIAMKDGWHIAKAAKPCKIKGFGYLKLFTHKSVMGHEYKFRCSEGITGFAIGSADTRLYASKHAARRLQACTKKSILKALKEAKEDTKDFKLIK